MPNCLKCLGLKVIYVNSLPVKCTCLHVDELKNYLTPLYSKAKYLNNSSISSIISKAEKTNLLFNDVSWEKIQSVVKSFLIHSKIKYSHLTTTPTEIIKNHINNHEIYDQYKFVDLLIIRFSCDVFNSHYQYILPNLLDHRKIYNKKTWICTSSSPSSQSFVNHYSQIVSDIILDSKSFMEITKS